MTDVMVPAGPLPAPAGGGGPAAAAPSPGPAPRWRLARRPRGSGVDTRGRRIGDWILIGLLVLVTVIAVLAPLLAPHDPVQPVAAPKLTPFTDVEHILGTDQIGRDTLSRVLVGLRTSWLLALVVTAVGLVVGAVVGFVAGMFGGWVDALLMRTTEVFLALPSMLVAVAVAAALGPGLFNTFLAVIVVWWPYYARIIRGEVRGIMARPHVEAARMAGVGRMRVMWRHVLPGVVPTAVITASLDIGNVVMVLASLSFLGLGQPAPAPELGADTSRGLVEILDAWWIPLVPGLAVMLLSLLSNLAGDAVRNRLAHRR
ncbi:ABC transporter permease [Cellulomonas chengniuliangii]|uniref:ABC transporter permease n=1 Tax=Cellulomonas chengniuliangii TaxID=2968084 RepID=A0ABY5L346_9CELL|nr:ABC transporter permease [Cellulomonas chengniuliangii]MCC2309446.1 ABC transporter permease [Cellulomonas chengniuliangii]MCC2316717.1 ABC transporter permease [Cellulomonas chengniuliangii]UUI74993.1 ABC transporter permease [Cellulomonas chengniuliangii]